MSRDEEVTKGNFQVWLQKQLKREAMIISTACFPLIFIASPLENYLSGWGEVVANAGVLLALVCMLSFVIFRFTKLYKKVRSASDSIYKC